MIISHASFLNLCLAKVHLFRLSLNRDNIQFLQPCHIQFSFMTNYASWRAPTHTKNTIQCARVFCFFGFVFGLFGLGLVGCFFKIVFEQFPTQKTSH